MNRKMISAAVLAASVGTAMIPSAAMARDYDYRDGYYERVSHDGYGRDYRRDGYYSRDTAWDGRSYRGRDRYYRERCNGGDGAVGTIAGGAGGALLGNLFGGGGLGTVLGGVGGALLGRSLDKQHTKERYGC